MIKWVTGILLACALLATACDKNEDAKDTQDTQVPFNEYEVTVSNSVYWAIMEQNDSYEFFYVVRSAEQFRETFTDMELPAVDFDREVLLVLLHVNSCAYTKVVPSLYDRGEEGILLRCQVDDGGPRPAVMSPWMVALGVDPAIAERPIVFEIEHARYTERIKK